MLKLPVCVATEFVLVSPHYPENVGACARALKTMGLGRLCLVKPSRLAVPEHPMAFKMAVKSWDVLEGARVVESLSEALRGHDVIFATTARRGHKGLRTPRQAARFAHKQASLGRSIAVVLGNEKTGLTTNDLKQCQHRIRIPMAADQPSVNLAQACQLIAYEWFCAGLEERPHHIPSADEDDVPI